MASRVGKGGKIVIGGANALHEVKSWTLTEKGDQVDTTSMVDNTAAGTQLNRTFLDGLSEWSGQVVMNYDPTDTLGQGTIQANTNTSIKVYPEGDAAGLQYFTGNVYVDSFEVKSSVDGVIEATLSFKGTGPLTKATM